jgi:hypothetical protein
MVSDHAEWVLASLAENQFRYLHQLEESNALQATRLKYGQHYDSRICDAIKVAGRKSILFDTVSIQPFNAPVTLLRYKARPEESVDDEITRLRSVEIAAETRRMKAAFDLSRTELDLFVRNVFREDETNAELENCFDSAWGEIERDVLSTLNAIIEVSKPGVIVTPISTRTPGEDINRLVRATTDRLRNGPVDAVIMSPDTLKALLPGLNSYFNPAPVIKNPNNRPIEAGLLYDNIHIYTDTYFPENELLAFRRSKDKHDRTVVWSPYLFGAGGFIGVPSCLMGLVFRGKITVLDVEITAHGKVQRLV